MQRRIRHLAATFERTDSMLLLAVAGMLVYGILVVYGAGSFNRQAHFSPLGQHFIIAKHLAMIGAGLGLLFLLVNADYNWFRSRWLNWGLLGASFALVALTLVLKGDRQINRWVTVMGFSLQPVELAKIALILFMAERLAGRNGSPPPRGRALGALLGCGVAPLVVMLKLQPNYGNIMVIVGVTAVVLFISDLPRLWRWSVIVLPSAASLLIYAVSHKVQERVASVLQGLQGGEYQYQVAQSLTGLGAGGWQGLGAGQSHNKYAFLPESHTDFVYSLVGEEFGLIGTLPLIALLVLIIWRGYGIAMRAPDGFGRILAAGLTTGLGVYGLANIAMVTGIFPVVGVPLPFVSFGGSAMLGALASVGLLLNIERKNRSYHVVQRRWERRGVV